MEEIINLTDIKNGFPGITPTLGRTCYEACMVSLHRNNHTGGVLLELGGDIEATIPLSWDDHFNDQTDRAWQDQEYTTEHGAICISAMLVEKCTDYTILERARKSTGIDYWLKKKEEEVPFKRSARLEISGIFKETAQNTLDKRLKIKKKQSTQSDETLLPAYISIVEFGKPQAIFAKK